MDYVKGDLLAMAEDGGFDIIVHGCNCFNTMGGGIAREIAMKYPQAYAVDCQTKSGDYMKLGNYTTTLVETREFVTFRIINAYTQYGFNRNGSNHDLFDYTAFELILSKLEHYYSSNRFGFPLIGCGLAGGNKTKIMSLIESFDKRIQFSGGGKATVVEYQP